MTIFQRSKRARHNLFWLLLIAWALPALACNLPALGPQAAQINQNEIRQTLTARSNSDPSSVQSPDGGGVSPQAPVLPGVENTSLSTPQPGPPPGQVFPDAPYNYLTQNGDTLDVVARRFGVEKNQVFPQSPLPEKSYLPVGTPIWIQTSLQPSPSAAPLFPDSEVINSPTALDFDVESFIASAGGYLNSHTENVNGEILTGAQIIKRVAVESSVNPRLLLAFLEHRSGWVFDRGLIPGDLSYPLGFRVPDRRGLYHELVMAATHLNIGYYGWRTGELKNIKFSDGSLGEVDPWLNPGTVGIQNLFAKFYPPQAWSGELYGAENFLDFYTQYFGSPWERAASVEPFLTPDLTQPVFELPFSPGERWSLTGGPHPAWNSGSPRGAIDFAPVTGEPPCQVSRAWVTASAAGVIARSANSVVALDLDGDGNEQTGWVIVYLHLADEDRVEPGQAVQVDERLGHPSCERGQSTGTHVHIARKYNGEWLPADYPLPMVLSGWQVQAEKRNYQGSLVKGDQIVTASPLGPRTSIVVR